SYQQQQPPAPAQAPTEDEDEQLLLHNPKQFVKKINDRMEQVVAEKTAEVTRQQFGPAYNSTLRNQITGSYGRAKGELKHFSRFEQEVLQLMNAWGQQSGPEVAIDFANWQHAYNVVVSRHHDTLVKEEAQALAKRRLEGDDEDEEMTDTSA